MGVNDVTVIHGDTAIVQYGIGTFGSRGLAVGGVAVYMAIQKLKDKASKIAAHVLQCEKATFVDGKFCADGQRQGRSACSLSVPVAAGACGERCQNQMPAEKL